MAKPTIFIVPGAFHTPSHYGRVASSLEAKGYEVVSIKHRISVSKHEDVNPACTLFDDAAEIKLYMLPLLEKGKEVVLVSHSYGSFPTTQSCEGNTVQERSEIGLKGGIKGGVSIAGFVSPSRGKDLWGNDEPTFKPLPYHSVKDGVVFCAPECIPVFYNDLNKEEGEAAYAQCAKYLSEQAFKTFPTYIESNIRCKKLYIMTEKDQAVPMPFQEGMVAYAGYETVRIDSGHSPFINKPEEVVNAIISVVDA